MGDAHRVHQLGLHPRAAATLRRVRRRGPRLPPGTGWTADPYVAPLRFTYGPRDANQVLKLLTSDALRAIRGHHTTAAAAVPTAASGTVIGVMAGRGMVSLNGPGKGMASIWTELIADNVPDGRVVRAGMAVHGKLDPQSRRLTLEGMRLSPTDALAPYEPGEVVLAIVRSVATEVCVVELLPGFAVSVAAADVIATKRRIDLRRLMTVGETLLARVVETGPTADQWRLSLVDIEIDDVAIPAPPILAGGPPWLIPPDDADDADDGAEAVADSFGATVGAADSGPGIYAPEPSVPAPQARDEAAAPVDPAVLQALTVERDQLFDELGSVREQRRTASKELETLRTEVRRASRFAERLQAENTGLRAELGRSAGDESLFTDPLEQLRFEVYQAWARRIPAAQKGELPLATWTVGPDFLDTLTMEALSRPSRRHRRGVDRARLRGGRARGASVAHWHGRRRPVPDARRRGHLLAGIAAGPLTERPPPALLAAQRRQHRAGQHPAPRRFPHLAVQTGRHACSDSRWFRWP